MSGIDILVSATDQASDVLDQVGDSGSTAADNLEISWGKVALAVTGAAAAMEMSNRSMQGVKTSVYQMAVRLGITRDAANALTRSISDVGFSLEDTSAVMTTGIRQGLRTADDIKKYAEYWEMVGRASGESAPELAEAGKTMGTMDVRAKNITDSMGAFDFIIGSTDLSIGFFIQTLGRSSKQLQDAHVGLNDVAIAMGFLEAKGYAGKAFMTKFKESLDQADGSRDTFFKNLGMSAGDLTRYAVKMEQAAGSTNKLAGAEKDTYTGLQRISAKLKEYQLQYEGLGMSIGNVANVTGALADGGLVIGKLWEAGKKLPGVFSNAAAAMNKISGALTALKAVGVIAVVIAIQLAITETVRRIMEYLMNKSGMTELAEDINKEAKDQGQRKGESRDDWIRRLADQPYPPPKGDSQPTGKGATSQVNHAHSGTITLKGVNDKDQFVAAADYVMGQLRAEIRGA